MDADPPLYTLDVMTDAELREYRCELEHSLTVLSPGAPVRNLLVQKLFAVLGEQASRPSPAAPEAPDADGESVSNN